MKVSFTALPNWVLEGSGDESILTIKPSNKFSKNFLKTTYKKICEIEKVLSCMFRTKLLPVNAFISLSKKPVGGFHKKGRKNYIYAAGKRTSEIVAILTHELCHVYIHNNKKIVNKLGELFGKKNKRDSEELLSQIIGLVLMNKRKKIDNIPNNILGKLDREKIRKFKDQFKKLILGDDIPSKIENIYL